MARKVKVDFTGVESYERVDEGRYKVKIAEVTEKDTQGGDPMLQIAFEVTAGDFKGSKVFESFVLTDKALWRLKSLLKTLGMKCDGKTAIDLDSLVGKTLEIEVYHDEYNGVTRAKVSDFFKAGSKSKAKAEDDDEDDDDSFDDEGEEEDEEEEEEEEAPKAKKPVKKAPAKKAPAAKKKAPEPEEEEDDDEDDEEDWEEDEEEEEPVKKPAKKPAAKTAKKPAAKKAPKKKAPEPDDDDDEDEDWEEDDE